MTAIWLLHEALVGIKTKKVLDEKGKPTGEVVIPTFKSLEHAKYAASGEKRLNSKLGWLTPVQVETMPTLEECATFTLPEEVYVSQF